MRIIYVYKITHVKTSRYYYGCHMTNNLSDGYAGSSRVLKEIYKENPYDEFTFEFIDFFTNSYEAAVKEYELIKKFIKQKKCLNKQCFLKFKSYNGFARPEMLKTFKNKLCNKKFTFLAKNINSAAMLHTQLANELRYSLSKIQSHW